MKKIGFIGAGHLADYTIRGVHRGGWTGEIFLSPRGKDVGAALARDCGCKVLESNQAVVDASNIVVLSTRPPVALDILADLELRADQVLMSVVAGIPLSELQAKAGEVGAIVRALPVTSAEVCSSPTLIYPAHADVEAFYAHCGDAIPVASEAEYNAASTLTCVYGWYLSLYEHLTSETVAAGISEERARRIVTGMAKGAAEVAVAQTEKSMDFIVNEIATEGTYTKRGLDHLKAKDAFAPWHEAFQLIRDAFQKE